MWNIPPSRHKIPLSMLQLQFKQLLLNEEFLVLIKLANYSISKVDHIHRGWYLMGAGRRIWKHWRLLLSISMGGGRCSCRPAAQPCRKKHFHSGCTSTVGWIQGCMLHVAVQQRITRFFWGLLRSRTACCRLLRATRWRSSSVRDFPKEGSGVVVVVVSKEGFSY